MSFSQKASPVAESRMRTRPACRLSRANMSPLRYALKSTCWAFKRFKSSSLRSQAWSVCSELVMSDGRMYSIVFEVEDTLLTRSLCRILILRLRPGGRGRREQMVHVAVGPGALEPPSEDASVRIRSDQSRLAYSHSTMLGRVAHWRRDRPVRAVDSGSLWSAVGHCQRASSRLIPHRGRQAIVSELTPQCHSVLTGCSSFYGLRSNKSGICHSEVASARRDRQTRERRGRGRIGDSTYCRRL